MSTEKDCTDGSQECADPVQDIYNFSTIIHPEYQYDNRSDIALIKLNEKAKLNQNNIKTICLPNESTNLQPNHNISVIGFGKIEFDQEPNTVLRYTSMKIISNDHCDEINTANKVSSHLKSSKIQFCAKGKQNETERDVTTCSGDSGGPAMVGMKTGQFFQVGVVSMGFNICGLYETIPSIFVNVNEYMDWISQYFT